MGFKWHEWFLPSFKINIYNHGFFFVNPARVIETNIEINGLNKNSLSNSNNSFNTNMEIFENKFSINDIVKNEKKGYFELNEIRNFSLDYDSK
jgi:hypothetical protein